MIATSQLSENVFLRLARILSADQLRALPTDRLPREIPSRVLEEVDDPDKREVLERMVHTAHTRTEAPPARGLSATEAEALDAAEQPDTSALSELNELVRDLAARGPVVQRELDWLDQTAQDLERAQQLARTVAGRVSQLSDALERLAAARTSDAATGRRVATATGQLSDLLARMDGALGEYHLLESAFARAELRAKRAECELKARRYRQLDDQVQGVRTQLGGTRTGLGRILGRRVPRRQRQHLVERLGNLTERRGGYQAFVSEDEVLRWLDVVVEAGLRLPAEQWAGDLYDVRFMLYQMLNLYCLQHKVPAHELASRLLRPNAHEVFEYCPETEQYLTGYFARKRMDVFQGYGCAAPDHLIRFQDTRETMFADYVGQASEG